MKDKLIELVNDVLNYLPWGEISSHTAQEIADYLIAHGVTVATENNVGHKWIPVTERLPDNDYGKHWKERTRYNVLVNGVVATATFGYREHGWWCDHRGYVFDAEHYNEVTHWQPAPEPPQSTDL